MPTVLNSDQKQPIGLKIEEISMRFGNLQALDRVSVELNFGSIHAVLGENGAGKSTLMNILGGFFRPTSGKISLGGASLELGNPEKMRQTGFAMVHQHFMLVPRFTIEENFALSAPNDRGLSAIPRAHIQKCFQIAKDLGWDFPENTETVDLPVGVQQRIEIVKALSTDAKIIILDEPTAVLSDDEIDELFRVIKTLKTEGKLIILIAHKLREIMAVADRASVLRKGKLVGEVDISSTSIDELQNLMLGDLPTINEPEISKNESNESGQSMIQCTDLWVKGDRGEVAIRGLNFEIFAGEILGIGGVDGNGQLELAEALANIREFSGSIKLNGKHGYIPQDRQRDGLAMTMSINENFLIANPIPAAAVAGEMISKSKTRQMVRRLIEDYRIKTGSVHELVSSLSGGNQQKIVVSRVLDQNPAILIVMNPTRGLDFKSSEFVRQMLEKARANGAAIVLISTDRDEISACSTRSVELTRGAFK